MKILAIETSCDETAVAVLEISGPLSKPDIAVLGNSLFSQAHLHEQYGGVYPNLAKREHIKNLPILLERTLKEAGVDAASPEIDCIAVTAGPGLEPALWTGITFAEELGKKWGKTVLPINHMEGHILSVLFGIKTPLALPALALLVSGGHTELVHVKDFGIYEVIGKTRDDAVGEAFDKVARLLGLPYPGGPQISRLAEADRVNKKEAKIKFPRPMINSGDLDFSFSGLKTAVLYKIKNEELTEEYKQEIARAFEDAAVEVLIAKTRQALAETGSETLIVGGGVAANAYLRESLAKLAQDVGAHLLLPVRELTTDNAVMIGIVAYIKQSTAPSSSQSNIKASGNLEL